MENYNYSRSWQSNNSLYIEYRLNGFLHRIDGPAYIVYDLNLKPLYAQYHLYGKAHRIDGLAIITFNKDGVEEPGSHWLFGTHITEKQFNTPGFIDSFILENS
jgi:hypothetical protein